MASLFRDARLKIKRANKHIADIQTRIAALPNSYTASIEINPEGGNEVIKHDITDRDIASDLALMIGDVVHNLKSALDYTWLGTIERFVPQAMSKFAKFPVYPSAHDLESALKGREIHTASPDLFRCIMSEIKPYDGGNAAIWTVHTLNKLDKHRLLIPVIGYAGIHGIDVENERGEISRQGFAGGTIQPPPYYVPIPFGSHVKNKGQLTVAIIFDEGTPVYAQNVFDTLRSESLLILKVVELLESVTLTLAG